MSQQLSESGGDRQPDWPEQVIGGKYVRLLEKHLRELRGKEAHGNRSLFLDDVFVVYLLAFFTPSVRSLRTIEDFSQTRQVQKHLSIGKICKSTLSDFNKLTDPERLAPIIDALRRRLNGKLAGGKTVGGDLAGLLKQTVAVDGTFLPAAADIAWSVANTNNHQGIRHRARLDAQVNVLTWLPEVIVVPEPGQSEAASAIEHLQPDRISVYDRGFMSFALLKAHHDQGLSRFVARYKPEGNNTAPLSFTSDRRLAREDVAAGVISDRTGRFDTETARRAGITEFTLREVVVQYNDQGESKRLRLITNLTEVSAATVALLYRHRWQVELFFRWLKSFANFGHLIGHTREGVLTHLYVTIIAALLMYLHTGYRPSKYLFVLLAQVAAGGATLDEVLPILRERERRCELDRQSTARRRAKNKSQNN